MDATGMTISMDASKGQNRIASVTAEITLPNIDVGKHKKGLLAAIENCIVKGSIEMKPEIKMILK